MTHHKVLTASTVLEPPADASADLFTGGVTGAIGRAEATLSRQCLAAAPSIPIYVGPGSLWLPNADHGVVCDAQPREIRMARVLLPSAAGAELVGLAALSSGAGIAFSWRVRAEAIAAARPVSLLGFDDRCFRIGSVNIPFESLEAVERLSRDAFVARHDRLAAAASQQWAALTITIASAALAWATEYATRRVASGRPLCQHQAVAIRLADCAISLDSARVALRETASPHPAAAHDLFGFVFAQTRIAVMGSMRVAGGHGYLRRNPVERWLRDLQTIGTLHGSRTSAVQS